jgi:hypothetical protein
MDGVGWNIHRHVYIIYASPGCNAVYYIQSSRLVLEEDPSHHLSRKGGLIDAAVPCGSKYLSDRTARNEKKNKNKQYNKKNTSPSDWMEADAGCWEGGQ